MKLFSFSKLLGGVLFSFLWLHVIAQPVKKVSMDEVIAIIDSSKTPIVVNFWATWCGPCVEELPFLEKQVQAFKDKNVKLLLVSLDFEDDYEKVLPRFSKKMKLKGEVVWLNETDASEFCPKIDKKWEGVIPVTLMVNKATRFRKFFVGGLTEKQIEKALKDLTKN
jgi:thiol-disulfide isomerase/thioredoxin